MVHPAPLSNGKQNADYLKQFGGLNIGYVTELIEQTESSPARISTLATAPLPSSTPNGAVTSNAALPGQLHGLLSYIDAIREYGYRVADLDPLLGRRSTRFPLGSIGYRQSTEQRREWSGRSQERRLP